MRSRFLTTIDQCKPVDQTTTPCRPKVYSTSELPNINTSKFSITAADILWLRFGKGFLSLGTVSLLLTSSLSLTQIRRLIQFWLSLIKIHFTLCISLTKMTFIFHLFKINGESTIYNWRTILIFCIFCVRFGRSQLCPQILLIAHAFLLALSYLRWNDSLK